MSKNNLPPADYRTRRKMRASKILFDMDLGVHSDPEAMLEYYRCQVDEGGIKYNVSYYENLYDQMFPEPLPILTVGELLTIKIPKTKLILDWLPLGGCAQIAAAAGRGKTFLALHLASCLVSKGAFLSYKIHRQCEVLYIDGEMNMADIRDRINLICDTEHPDVLKKIHILSQEYLYAEQNIDLDLAAPNTIKRINDFLALHPNINVIIWDNLSCLFKSIEEDKRDHWVKTVLPQLTKAKNNGSTVIFLHHLNKSGGSRGTNARSDTLDASIILETPEDWKEEDGLDVIWRFDKGRRCSPKSKIPLRVQMNEEGVFS
jgi:putative DNA primase/helicase